MIISNILLTLIVKSINIPEYLCDTNNIGIKIGRKLLISCNNDIIFHYYILIILLSSRYKNNMGDDQRHPGNKTYLNKKCSEDTKGIMRSG